MAGKCGLFENIIEFAQPTDFIYIYQIDAANQCDGLGPGIKLAACGTSSYLPRTKGRSASPTQRSPHIARACVWRSPLVRLASSGHNRLSDG